MDELEKILLEIKQLNEVKEYEKVVELLTDSILEDYTNDNLYFESALAYYRLGKYDLSDNILDRTLLLNPQNGVAYNLKGIIYMLKKIMKKVFSYILEQLK